MTSAVREARLQNAAAYMAVDLESDRVVIEMVFDAAYAYITGGVAADPMDAPDAPDVLSPGLFDFALNCLALHWYDHRSDMAGGAFPAALRPILTQLKAQGGGLIG